MSGCNATLQTWTEACDLDHWLDTRPDCGCVYVEDGYDVRHVALRTLPCHGRRPHEATDDHFYRMADGGAVVLWHDNTPGARPHTPPLVSDAEVQAAWREITGSGSVPPTRTDMSRALRAAARVRQGDDL